MLSNSQDRNYPLALSVLYVLEIYEKKHNLWPKPGKSQMGKLGRQEKEGKPLTPPERAHRLVTAHMVKIIEYVTELVMQIHNHITSHNQK